MSIITGDCLEVMSRMEDNSISSIVTDPPYGLKFMGKEWDHGIPGVPFWREALRISKPGSFLLAFGGTRTYHRLACAIEDAGWEIRDCLQWIYGSGFPKSLDVSKAVDKAKGEKREKIKIPYSKNVIGGGIGIERPWKEKAKKEGYVEVDGHTPISQLAQEFKGYGTALKPAHEPIIMAMKPCHGTFAQNAEKWGQAGINIDECRIGKEKIKTCAKRKGESFSSIGAGNGFNGVEESFHSGRWPANVLFDEEAAKVLDEQSGMLKSGTGGASRFFYCAKASPAERNEGLEHLEDKLGGGFNSTVRGDSRTGHVSIHKNNHPTVKPLKLMKYLIKLVMPPKDGILLDPFCGSGSTIIAAQELGCEAVGIEQNEEYAEIARNRLVYGESEEVKHVLGL